MVGNTKLLSHGGKLILIKHVLQAIPVYTMAAMNPPKGTIDLIEKHFVRFFWGSSTEKSKYHWSSWENLCKAKDEGGIGIKRLQDISDTFTTKRWWNFRTNQSPWAAFLLSKYCTRVHAVATKKVSNQSSAWQKLLSIRMDVSLIFFGKSI